MFDPALPAADDLLDDRAGDLLALSLDGMATIQAWRRTQITYRPGQCLIARYGVDVRWNDGTRRVETLVAQHGVDPLPEGLTVLGSDAATSVGFWRYPFDPYLPGLAPAAHRTSLGPVLERLGIDPRGARIVPRAYRPGRRAVLEVSELEGPPRCYVKVLLPRRLERIRHAHGLLAEAGLPVPAVLAVAEEQGLLVLEAIPGRSLRDGLLGEGSVPYAAAVVGLQDRLARVPLAGAKVAARPFDPSGHAHALRRLLGDDAEDVEEIAERALDAAGSDPLVMTHGDLYEAQIFGLGGRLSGLIDLDGVGPGHLIDDAGTMIAHLVVLGQWRPAAERRIRRWCGAYERALASVVDLGRARRRAAGVLLGLALGPFTTCEPGWEAATRMRLAAARELAGLASRGIRARA